jgi:hypothetical protein
MFSRPKGSIGNRYLVGAMKFLTSLLLTFFCSYVYADNSENNENVAEVLNGDGNIAMRGEISQSCRTYALWMNMFGGMG